MAASICRMNSRFQFELFRQPITAMRETAKFAITLRECSSIYNQNLPSFERRSKQMHLDFKGIDLNCDFMHDTVGIVQNTPFPRIL